MQLIPAITYPEGEKPKLGQLERLFSDWHRHFAANASAFRKHKPEDMVFDGFYPHYFSQKKKILFIGWEPVGISGENYMDVLYHAYHTTKTISNRDLNNDKFHSRVLRIAFGIVNGMPKWDEIPSPREIGDMVGMAEGLSFASMNISKLSNDNESSRADGDVIAAAYTLSIEGRNFIKEEVAILEPHVIITMNTDRMPDNLSSLGSSELIHKHASGVVASWWQDVDGRRCLLIDTHHFSARFKDDVADFYDPICDGIRRAVAAPN